MRDGRQDRVLHELHDPAHESFYETLDPLDRSGEDGFRLIPDPAKPGDIGEVEPLQEIQQRLLDGRSNHAERLDLLRGPVGDLVEHAAVVQRLRDQTGARNELDHRAQDVPQARVDGTHVDRIDAEHDREHAKAGDDVGLIRDVVERRADAEAQPLDLRRHALLDAGSFGPLHDGPLLDGVGQLVRKQLGAIWLLRPVLVAAEENVSAIREGAGGEACRKARRILIGVDPHGAEVRFHEAANVVRQRRARRQVAVDVLQHVVAHRGLACGIAVETTLGVPAQGPGGFAGWPYARGGHAHHGLRGGTCLSLRGLVGRGDPYRCQVRPQDAGSRLGGERGQIDACDVR